MEARHAPERPGPAARWTPGKFEAMTRAIIGFEVDPTTSAARASSTSTSRPRTSPRRSRGSAGAGATTSSPRSAEVTPADEQARDFRLRRHAGRQRRDHPCRAVGTRSREHGLDVPPPDVSRRVIGLSLVEAMAALAAGRTAKRHVAARRGLQARISSALRAEGRVEEPLFDGIARAARRARGGRLAARGRDRQIGPRARALP